MTEKVKFRFCDILDENTPGYDVVLDEDYVSGRRWYNGRQITYQRRSDGTFWQVSFSIPKTEYQDWENEDNDMIEATQMERYTEAVTKYRVM